MVCAASLAYCAQIHRQDQAVRKPNHPIVVSIPHMLQIQAACLASKDAMKSTKSFSHQAYLHGTTHQSDRYAAHTVHVHPHH